MSKKSEERRKKYRKTTLNIRKAIARKNVSKGEKAKERIKKVAIEFVKNNGKKSMGELMLEMGYSESYARNPQYLTRSKEFQEVMNELMPEAIITKVRERLDEGLDAVLIDRDPENKELRKTDIPDHNTRVKFVKIAIDMILKTLPKEDDVVEQERFSLVKLAKASDLVKGEKEKQRKDNLVKGTIVLDKADEFKGASEIIKKQKQK